jgi:NAD(P)-dependent dehydrogenase (short-subunit alcohol dehydrogenase family)
MSENQKVAVVTGSSTGIGYETSLALANNSYLTYATVRDIQKSKEIERIAHVKNIPLKIVEMNVDNDNSVKDAIEKITSEYGRIDILVNNAGYGLFGALEDLEMTEIKKQFETNVFGIIRVIQNVLPAMRLHRTGIIVNISSISGLAGIPSQSAYAGTKFAVEGLSESLSYELEPFGIKIVLIEPGVINTEFLQDLVVPTNRYGIDKNKNQINISNVNTDNISFSFYHDTIKKFLSFYYNAMSNAPHPRIVADEIIQAIEKVSNETNAMPILRIAVGNDSKKYSRLKKELQDNEFHKVIRGDLLS